MYGTTKASAHVYSPPLRSPRRERKNARCRRPGRPTSTTDALSIIRLSRDLVLREDLLDPLERLLDRRLRFRPLLRHVDHRYAPHVLGVDFRHGGVDTVEVGGGGPDKAVWDVTQKLRALGFLPDGRFCSDGHDGRPAPKPRLG